METPELKQLVVDSLNELKAKNIVVLDVKKMTCMTDLMIIASGTSTRHVISLAKNIIQDCKAAHLQPIGIEGENQGEWVLVDLGAIIVHVMLPETREFYDIQSLWEITNEKVIHNKSNG